MEQEMKMTDKLDVLKEIAEDMENKIISMTTVAATQHRIIEVLTKENAEEFKDLIEETEKQIGSLNEQAPILNDKRETLLKVIDCMENNEDTHQNINALLNVFGLFE